MEVHNIAQQNSFNLVVQITAEFRPLTFCSQKLDHAKIILSAHQVPTRSLANKYYLERYF